MEKEHKRVYGKRPLKCSECVGEMVLYKMVYRNKDGELKECGGIRKFIRKITV